MGFINICNRIIEYSFYAIFLLVPLAFTSKTSELFELNKMWLTWALTIIIVSSWLIKMILQKKFFIQRTPLDIPIGLFLASQIISTIFSLDSHVSLWGYYSRFNGGLLSIISYIFLYYAFVTFANEGVAKEGGRPDNAQRSEHWREGLLLTGPRLVKRLLTISLISGLIVALWGLPSHFGYDPTCLLFRGTFDVSCWTADFMPKVRIFSTLGQPAWLAAYLAILIPIAIVKAIRNKKEEISRNSRLLFAFHLSLIALFYIDLFYTRARAGILGIWISLIFFFSAYIFTEIRNKQQAIRRNILLISCLLLLITFVIGTPFSQLNIFSLDGIKNNFQKAQTSKTDAKKDIAPTPAPTQSFESGGTESADIRRYVWMGAINAWKANPLFGTGVETFAFAYYKYKPAGQNLTSEWNFLYNKAHNEYLNYLATTGLFGLGTYLLMIAWFFLASFKHLKTQMSKLKSASQNSKPEKYTDANYTLDAKRYTLIIALLASYLSILITNFFGFSVVMTNIYLFMIPAFVFVLMDIIKSPTAKNKPITPNSQLITETSVWQWTPIFFILIASCFLLIFLFRFWRADIAYALGYNLDRAGEYQQAYPNLHKAVKLRISEPVFKDELSINNAIIASSLLSQKDKEISEQTISTASTLAQEAINVSNEIISQYPNNAVFWKTRTKLFYTLSQVDARYLPRALDAITKAYELAPNDANISYNLGVLHGQNNNIAKGIETLEKTVKLKPDYRDAYYALGLFYNEAGQNEKAIAQMQYILNNISPNDSAAKESIKSWEKK